MNRQDRQTGGKTARQTGGQADGGTGSLSNRYTEARMAGGQAAIGKQLDMRPHAGGPDGPRQPARQEDRRTVDRWTCSRADRWSCGCHWSTFKLRLDGRHTKGKEVGIVYDLPVLFFCNFITK